MLLTVQRLISVCTDALAVWSKRYGEDFFDNLISLSALCGYWLHLSYIELNRDISNFLKRPRVSVKKA